MPTDNDFNAAPIKCIEQGQIALAWHTINPRHAMSFKTGNNKISSAHYSPLHLVGEFMPVSTRVVDTKNLLRRCYHTSIGCLFIPISCNFRIRLQANHI